MEIAPTNHWSAHARQWQLLGSPLRPCEQDVARFRQLTRAGRTVLLGVTPELANVSDDVTAVDNSPAMIAAVWPGNRAGSVAMHGDWLNLPMQDGDMDNVVGDGCLVLLHHPIQHSQLFAEIARILKPGGRLVMRCFVRPSRSESLDELQSAVLAGEIKSFHALKWRLAMGLNDDIDTPNLAVRDIYAAFQHFFPDRLLLAECTKWSVSSIATIDAYRDSNALYSFPTLTQLRECVSPLLKNVACDYGSYELAERCPLLTWERCR